MARMEITMTITTKVFGEVTIDEERIINFPGGIIGFPDLTQFAMLHDEEDGVASIHWLQSIQEPGFAMPVMDPLIVKENYNPEVDDELLKPLGEIKPDELLVLVTVSVPQDLTKMTVNLKGPIIINAGNRTACQAIVEGDEYKVKFPIYDILQARKAGE
jgi:flagellar assembly factor FliW